MTLPTSASMACARSANASGAMRGGAAASRVGVVDHVVVHERRSVEDLERGSGGDDLRWRRGRGPGHFLHCPPPGDAEPPAEALSTVQSRRSGLDEEPRFGSEIGRCGSLGREEVVQTLGNRFNGIRRG